MRIVLDPKLLNCPSGALPCPWCIRGRVCVARGPLFSPPDPTQQSQSGSLFATLIRFKVKTPTFDFLAEHRPRLRDPVCRLRFPRSLPALICPSSTPLPPPAAVPSAPPTSRLLPPFRPTVSADLPSPMLGACFPPSPGTCPCHYRPISVQLQPVGRFC